MIARRPPVVRATIGGMSDDVTGPPPPPHAPGAAAATDPATAITSLGASADEVLGMANAPEPGATTGIRFIDAMLDKAVSVPSAAIHAHVDKLRARNPQATPEQIGGMLEKQYLLAGGAAGGAVGAAAAAPAVGTGAATALTASEVAAFFAASAAFALGVADVHGIAVDDVPRRKALLLATVLGEQGARTVGEQAGLASGAWARSLLVNMPTTTIRRVNTALTRRLLRRQAARHGALAMGRLVPFGVGAAIGVTGGRALGRTVVEGARKAFGPPPLHFPRTIEIAPPEVVAAARELDLLPTRQRKVWMRGRRRVQ